MIQGAGVQTLSPNSREKYIQFEEALDEAIASCADSVVALRRELHRHPEPSGSEFATSKRVLNSLHEANIDAQLLDRGLGVLAEIPLGTEPGNGPCIVLRGDLDALRLEEASGIACASLNPGLMHACGHDAHSSMVAGAGLVIAHLLGKSDLQLPSMRLRLLFQPAEETAEGAKWLLDQDVVDGADAIIGLHVDPEYLTGHIGIRYGMMTANCDEVSIQITGRGGHAARPHHTIDPIAIAAQLISSLYALLPRSIDSRRPAVLSFGHVQGGYTPNVIPETVQLRGTLRTTNHDVRRRLIERIRHVCDGMAAASESSIELDFLNELPGVENETNVTTVIEEASRRVVGSHATHLIELPSMGGEDFAFYQRQTAGSMFRLGCGVPGEENPYLHSPRFRIDESCLNIGIGILLRSAVMFGYAHDSASDA